MEQAAVPFQSNKRKIEIVSPVSGGDGVSVEMITREKTCEEYEKAFNLKRVSPGSSGFFIPIGKLNIANSFAYCRDKAWKNRDLLESLEFLLKKDSVSPATENSDDVYKFSAKIGKHVKFYVQKKPAIECSSFPSKEKEDSSDLHESTERKTETVFSPIAEQVIPFPPTMKRGTAESSRFSLAVQLASEVVAHYNDKNKEWMKVLEIKEAFSQWEEDEQIYFILFRAELIPKDGKESWERDCRSVLFYDVQSHPRSLHVFYVKLGSWKEEDIQKWTKKRGYRRVLYSESMKKMDTAEEIQSDNKEEDVDSDSDSDSTDDDSFERPPGSEAVCPLDDKDMDMDMDLDTDENTGYDLIKVDVNPMIEEFAMEAVANYNTQEELPRMELGEIKEVFSQSAPEMQYFINFDARFINEYEETKRAPCRAVVATHSSGLMKVWFLKVGSPAGIGKDDWEEEGTCVYEFPPWQHQRLSTGDLLKSRYPEWCFSSDDEEDKKMKPGSSNQPPPTSIHVEN